MNIDEFPKHLTLSLEHNNHKNYYSSIIEYFETNELYKDCISQEDLKICIEKDELWELHWYPRTPISFYHIISYSLERCLELSKDIKDGD